MNDLKKKEIFVNNNLFKTKGVNNFSKSTKGRKNYNNIQNKNSKTISIKKRDNLTINNKSGNLNNNFTSFNKKEISTTTINNNCPSKNNKNTIEKCLENKDKIEKKEYNKEYNLLKSKYLNIFEFNNFNEDYLIQRYKMINFSDIKVKKMKSNFDSIILNYKKNIPKLNNIKSKLNKKNNIEKKENNN